MKRFRGVRLGKNISFFIDMKAIAVILVLAVILFAVILLSIGMGEVTISPVDVFKVLIGQGSEFHHLIVNTFRLPRVLIALFAGMSLAISGALLQAMVRNPLASPDIIGITGGASVAAVSIITLFSDSTTSLSVSLGWIPFAAFLGATVTALLMYAFAWKKGVSPFRLVLVGIGLYTATQAITNLIILLGPVYRAVQSKTWLTGSVYGSEWKEVYTLLPWVCILIPLAFFMSRTVNIQQFGDDIAIGAGDRVQRNRLFILLLGTGLAGSAVAFAGAISFVGLIAPHAARRMVGSSYDMLLPTSALLGGIIVVLADLVGRTIVAPLEVPAGVFTAAIGAPYFIFLLIKTKNQTG
ncbi:FecCD family ABC transporter permease [Thermoflavimicrobium dichotomicum]|uniref:Iron complex transport system permease protein n=1 Tax=Thermoflavimicrobium dichotomicum TaxID=46223 RepID=A0A1I3LSU4_9BACL|nr:iron ABC transporter permease [Thermoflavimicrobium dichotomicum]SFI87767.1 iron complex transport system permease protein [Thermoflavimicrobium dichotomicum]